MVLYYENDSENTWTKFLSFIKEVFTTIDNSRTYIIYERDKVFEEPIKYTYTEAKILFCSKHENIYITTWYTYLLKNI